MAKPARLYLITRRDLAPGVQLCQTNHALTEFIFEHGEVARAWRDNGNTLVALEVEDERGLDLVREELAFAGHKVSEFREPDLDNQLTAIAVCGTAEKPIRRMRLSLVGATNA